MSVITAGKLARPRVTGAGLPVVGWVRGAGANLSLVIGCFLVGGVILTAIVGPWIAPYDPIAQDIRARLAGPSAAHLLGTDAFGRDILSRLLYGARASLTIAGIAIGSSAVIGTFLGILAAHRRGWIDRALGLATDFLLVFPTLVMSLMLVVAIGQGVKNVTIAMGLAFLPRFIRLARGAALAVEEEDYIMASRALGASGLRIMLRHVLPNISSPVLILVTLWLGIGIEAEASLSFLGVGVPQPEPSWGLMTRDGLKYILTNPWQATYPILAILVTVLGLNLLGDELRDRLDPRLQQG